MRSSPILTKTKSLLTSLPEISLISQRQRSTSTTTCPHAATATAASGNTDVSSSKEWENALPYHQVPGPKPLPILGNTWRMMPIIGQYTISDVAKISSLLHERYGRIVRFSGLIGRPDLLFIYDVDEIEKISANDGLLWVTEVVGEAVNFTTKFFVGGSMKNWLFNKQFICVWMTIHWPDEVHRWLNSNIRGDSVQCKQRCFKYHAVAKCYRNEGPTPFRPSMPSLVKYKSVVRKDFFGDLGGVVGVHGEPWRQFRSRVQKPVLQLSTVRRYLDPLEEVTNDFLQRCETLLDENSELPDDFDNEIHKWSLECIGRVALDARLGCLEPNLPEDSEPQQIINAAKYALRNVATLELKAPFWRYFPTPLWTRYVNNMNFFVEVCMKYIKSATDRMKSEGYTQSGEPSLLEKVILSEKDDKIATIMALDLILVGIDTISMAVCSMLYQLATRPEEQEKVREELRRVLPTPDTPLTIQLLDQMHYLKAFIREVFRVYSTVIGNGRTLQEDTVICGYQIPKGVQAVFPTIVTGNMEEYVTDAGTFKPERWLKANQGEGKLHPFASLPYGYGARMCLGRRFADLEMQILLSKLIRNYKLEFKHEQLEYAVTFMYAPEGALKFKMTKV